MNRARKGDGRKEITLEARGSEAGRLARGEGAKGVPAKKVKITRASALPPQPMFASARPVATDSMLAREQQQHTQTGSQNPIDPFKHRLPRLALVNSDTNFLSSLSRT